MIGELAALRGTLDRKRTLFLLPLRALVNDKHQYFLKTYGDFGIRTIRATGEITDDIPDLMRGRFDICLMTYEKFAAMILGSPHILEQVGTVVVDEVQMITDKNRGVNLEFILTMLRTRRSAGIEPQIIALSAVIGDTSGFERWLGARLLRSNHRPVPLHEGIITTDGAFRYIDSDGSEKCLNGYISPEYRKGSSQDYIIPLVRKLVAEGKQVIVFRETKGEARGCANYLAESLGLPGATDALSLLPDGDPSSASNALRQSLTGGVAFHNADLDRDERLIIEQEFRKPSSSLKIIAATTTLAMGINTPAEAVIIPGSILVRHHHGDGRFRRVHVECAARRNQLHKLWAAVVVADIKRIRDAVASIAAAFDGMALADVSLHSDSTFARRFQACHTELFCRIERKHIRHHPTCLRPAQLHCRCDHTEKNRPCVACFHIDTPKRRHLVARG